MNLDQIPTPESDAAYKQLLLESDKSHRIRMGQKMKSLERRLNVAREALQCTLVDMSVNEGLTSTTRGVIRHVSIPTVKEALTQTAPKL